MQPPQINNHHNKLEMILQAYAMFSSNQSYQQKCPLFKKKIQNDDHFIIKVVVNAMKNILTYRQITNWREIFKIQKITKEDILFQAYNTLYLAQFSKLLVLRFLRETYFESNYLFVNYVNIQLSDLMLKIGQFKKQSRDDERGRYMFYPQSKLFTNLNQQEVTKKIDKQLETIGFSIHKLALEILFTCGKLSRILPFHQQFVNNQNSKLNESFNNGFYVVYKRLAEQSIKFPSKFHYFKQKDVTKFSQAILNQYEKFIKVEKPQEQPQQVEYINIEKQSIAQQEIQIAPSKSTLNSLKICNSYRINLMGSQRRYNSEDKNTKTNSATSSPLSFVQSLKVNVSKPNEALVKSLSSSRKLNRMNQKSSSHIKSFSSNELSQLGQSVSIQKQAQCNALPPFSVPPQFKQVFIEHYENSLFQKSIQNISNPIKNSIKRVANINRNNDLVARKYINNFIEQNMTQAKKQSANEASLYSLKIQQDLCQISSFQNKMIPSSRNTSDKSFRKKDCKNKEGSYARSIKQLETQQVVSSKQSIQQQTLRRQNSTETQMCFYFTPKAKKELLKKKILVKKQGSLQVGMIVNLQEDIIASQFSTIKRYAISLKIFISTLVPLQKVNVSIKFPNWLECISKANTAKEGMKEQTQFIANFIVQLKSSRERIIKRNYGELPIITVVYVDRSDKKQIVSQPLYILPNRFSIEKTFTQEELSQLIQSNYKVSTPFLVHERIAVDIKSMRQYFPSLTMHNLQVSEKMQLFEMQEMIVEDQIGVVKLQYVKNNQQMILILLEGKMESSNNSRPAIGRSYLFVQLHPLKQEKWSYEQLHIFRTCLRSILCADK